MRLARLSVATFVAASLVLGGCGGDKEDSDDPESQDTAAGANVPSTWPLTGLPVADGEDSAQEHPVMVAKIDNSGKEPQAGLSKADLVVEELVEGGYTRLAAFFYSELPINAGPMRSMRFSDIGIVQPVNGDIVTSGGAPPTIKRIEGAGIDFFGEGTEGFSRDDTKAAPYNLMADIQKVAAGIKQDAERPADYLAWGKADATLGGQSATTLSASFSGAAHVGVEVRRRPLRARRRVRSRRRFLRAGHRARAARQDQRGGVHGPARKPGSRDALHRRG